MKERAAALPTVLALVAAVLVMGLAMGSLSTLSLQFNRVQLDSTRGELAARSGLARFLADVHKLDAEGELDPLMPSSTTLSDQLPEELVYQEGPYRVVVHFDPSKAGFSTDNLSGDTPRLGWADSDGTPRVPAFSLDLTLRVEGPGQPRTYRAVLKRVWPYAVYATRGPMVLMGQPEHQPTLSFPMPSKIEGDAFTSWLGAVAGGGTVRSGYGLGPLTDPSKLLANVEARAGYHPRRTPDYPMIIGMPVGYNPPPLPIVLDRENDQILYSYDSLVKDFNEAQVDPTFSPGLPQFNDIGNLLDGDFFYDHDLGEEVPPVLVGEEGENQMAGRHRLRRGPVLDPLAQMSGGADPTARFSSAGFVPLNLPLPPDDTATRFGLAPADVEQDDDDGQAPFLLRETLTLTESENSTGGSLSSHYVVDGSVSNRQVLYHGGKLMVREVAAGLVLQGTVLHVKGDLDLGASVLDQPIPISGSGSTLVVDGKLVLGNAHIDAGDQGFVIYAEDIVLKGGGTFYGLMIAANSLTILSQSEQPLKVEGGIMCGGLGGIVLRGAEVKHEPRYLKSVNGGGEYYLSSWTELN